MLSFEIRKIFGAWGSKVALVLLAATVALNCWIATDVGWVNGQGVQETGPAAVANLREAKRAWAGPLDTARLTAALRENRRINATAEGQSEDIRLADIAYGWKQGFSDIREVINNFLAVDFSTYDYWRVDGVQEADLPGLYAHRVTLLQDWLYDKGSDADNRYSEQEKQWLIARYGSLETPMDYTYYEGWAQLCENSQMVTMMCAMILGYLVAGIFANEFKWKADSVYFSTMLGRTRNTSAKIQAGFLVVTGAYWTSMLLYSLYTLCYLGFDGWNCPIQLERWKCFYNLTFLETYLLIALGGYLGNLFSAFLVMWAAAKTRSAVVPVTLPFLLIFLPNFLQNHQGTLVGQILGLLPDRLLQINSAINYFDLYPLGPWVLGAIPVLFVLYILATGTLVPLMYREFRDKGKS